MGFRIKIKTAVIFEFDRVAWCCAFFNPFHQLSQFSNFSIQVFVSGKGGEQYTHLKVEKNSMISGF
jgi:hypothetical protein